MISKGKGKSIPVLKSILKQPADFDSDSYMDKYKKQVTFSI